MVLTGSERGLVDTGTDALLDARASSLSVLASLQGKTMTTCRKREREGERTKCSKAIA